MLNQSEIASELQTKCESRIPGEKSISSSRIIKSGLTEMKREHEGFISGSTKINQEQRKLNRIQRRLKIDMDSFFREKRIVVQPDSLVISPLSARKIISAREREPRDNMLAEFNQTRESDPK
jgi:hypothetical protein